MIGLRFIIFSIEIFLYEFFVFINLTERGNNMKKKILIFSLLALVAAVSAVIIAIPKGKLPTVEIALESTSNSIFYQLLTHIKKGISPHPIERDIPQHASLLLALSKQTLASKLSSTHGKLIDILILS